MQGTLTVAHGIRDTANSDSVPDVVSWEDRDRVPDVIEDVPGVAWLHEQRPQTESTPMELHARQRDSTACNYEPGAQGSRKPNTTFKLLRKWEGLVVGYGTQTFTARLRDLTEPGKAELTAELPISELSSAEQEWLAEGNVFYWMIGYRDEFGRPRQRVSEIRFRRLPAPSSVGRENAAERARKIAEDFGWRL